MPETAKLSALIENAASLLPPYWPLRSFIAANPLQGLENLPFEQAVAEGARLFGGRGYPTRAMAGRALAAGRIDRDLLDQVAARNGRPGLAGDLLAGADDGTESGPALTEDESEANRLMIKWLAPFLDEGQAAWPMPHRELGFYRAWRRLALHDGDIPGARALADRPDEALGALLALTGGLSNAEIEDLFTRHLAALPGWASYVKWRAGEMDHPWRRAAPISLADFLAVRLTLADLTGEQPAAPSADAAEDAAIGAIILEAWEESYRRRLTAGLMNAGEAAMPAAMATAAQLIFCIDVRSEVLRRHLERTGPYETLGFAGFFGIPLAFQPYGEEHAIASCPVLLQPKHLVTEAPAPACTHAAHRHLRGKARLSGLKGLLRSLKESVAGAFAFVEASGLAFGALLAGRTLAPVGFDRAVGRLRDAVRPGLALTAQVDLHHHHGHEDPVGLSPGEQAYYAEAVLRIMGLTEGFAPLVVLCGHGGQTANNPFAAGLDCGACGGNRGGPNARAMTAVLNAAGTRAALAERGIFIPEDTVFVAAEHNTTTDTLTLLGEEAAAARHQRLLDALKADLELARRGAVRERLARLPGGADMTPTDAERRAADWAQVRPEWALARNAAFIVAHRGRTRALDLEGRCFLHSYDWRNDAEGKALEVILTAPMVVAEWINTQYYFSTIDNARYGAGSKVTHNVVGAVGVMQGNASDLMTGLPAQSVLSADGQAYHEPLRLMTVVEAPVARIEAVVARNTILQTLFGNGWVALQAMDPETGTMLRRSRTGDWRPVGDADAPATSPASPAVATAATRRHDAAGLVTA